MNGDSGLRSRKFWLVVGLMGIGAVRMFITGLPIYAEISPQELAIWSTLCGVVGGYLGVNYFVKKLGSNNGTNK